MLAATCTAKAFRFMCAPRKRSILPCASWRNSSSHEFFNGIYGDKLEYASHSKIDLLARILSEHALTRESAWMVGDRVFDIDAAHANNIRCVAAAWGYGTPEEWAQADAVAATPGRCFRVRRPAGFCARTSSRVKLRVPFVLP